MFIDCAVAVGCGQTKQKCKTDEENERQRCRKQVGRTLRGKRSRACEAVAELTLAHSDCSSDSEVAEVGWPFPVPDSIQYGARHQSELVTGRTVYVLYVPFAQ
jgi:hypothetical protein